MHTKDYDVTMTRKLAMICLGLQCVVLPVLPDQVSTMAEQILLGRTTQLEGPEVVEAHLWRAGLAWVPAKQVVHLDKRGHNIGL